jgi:superfamily I DNA/RNA helicase
MVGDDDQSIHRWRGAHPDGLEQFKKEFSPEVYKLERNYRSLASIVNSATRLIRHNEKRLEKNPYPTREQQEAPIPYLMHESGDDMADAIARDLKERIDGGLFASNAAILYRTNAMSKVLEGALMRHGVPYRVKKGQDIMSYSEVKMLMAAARLAVNQHDKMAFERISSLVPGLGPKSVDKIAQAGNTGGVFAGITAAPARHKETLEKLKSSMASLYAQGPHKLLGWAIGPGGFKQWLRKEAEKSVKARFKTLEGEDLKNAVSENLGKRIARLQIVQDTVRLRLEELDGEPEIEELWTSAMDMLIQPPDEDLPTGSVTLSTVHGAKGLQWDTVHVAGFSETLMPFEREGAVQDMTEERCLAYVAMTRAENNLFLHHPMSLDLKMGTGPRFLKKSRFVGEFQQIEERPTLFRFQNPCF